MPYDLGHALHEVQTASDGYIAVSGVLTFDPARLPKTDWNNQDQTPALTRIPAQISGKSLTRSGFTSNFNQRITLNVACFGPWCAGASSGKPVLAFLNQTPSGYTLNVTPCSGHAFYNPSPNDLQDTKTCYLTGSCPKPTLDF